MKSVLLMTVVGNGLKSWRYNRNENVNQPPYGAQLFNGDGENQNNQRKRQLKNAWKY